MSRETEKAMQKMMDYVAENSSENADQTEIENLLQQYMSQQTDFFEDDPVCVDDYLELAEKASSGKKKLEYLKKALELEPDNLDAAMMMAEETSKTVSEYLEALAALIEKGDKLMEKEGYFSHSMGDFWLVFDTRPYMRLRSEYFHLLTACGKLRPAAAEGRRMLELCEGDNLGARFQLMHIYAALEEEEAAEKLFEKYGDNDESLMLLPMTVLYFKLNKLDKAGEYLDRLLSSNKDTKKFFTAAKNGKLDKYNEEISPYGYRPYTIDELLTAVTDYAFLYINTAEFFFWAYTRIKQTGSKQSTAKKKK